MDHAAIVAGLVRGDARLLVEDDDAGARVASVSASVVARPTMPPPTTAMSAEAGMAALSSGRWRRA
jgi:hypothetical protein